MSSATWHPFCLGLTVLLGRTLDRHRGGYHIFAPIWLKKKCSFFSFSYLSMIECGVENAETKNARHFQPNGTSHMPSHYIYFAPTEPLDNRISKTVPVQRVTPSIRKIEIHNPAAAARASANQGRGDNSIVITYKISAMRKYWVCCVYYIRLKGPNSSHRTFFMPFLSRQANPS